MARCKTVTVSVGSGNGNGNGGGVDIGVEHYALLGAGGIAVAIALRSLRGER